MMILQAFGAPENLGPLWRAYAQIHARVLARVHAFVLARLVSFNPGDLRWAVAAMALGLLGTAWAFGERQFAQWARRVLHRAWQGARFAAEMSDAVAPDLLKAFVERIERLEEEKASIAGDVKEVYAEAKAQGFDAKILRKVVALRKRDVAERREEEEILDLYLQALGMMG